MTVLALVACLGLPDHAQTDEPKAAREVRFELLRSLHIAVDVKVNDAGPYRLIFDLGAPINLISGRFAVEAGMISKEAAARPAFFGMRGEKIADSFQVGDVVAEKIPVMVMDHPTIKAISEVLGPIDGIVGYPFYARYRVEIDYPANTMVFTPGDYKPQNVMQQMLGRMFNDPNAKKKRVSASGLWGMELHIGTDDTSGVRVGQVWPASPAAAAGIRSGDRLLTLDGRWTDTVADAIIAASFARLGEEVTVAVEREGKRLNLQVTPTLGL